jgi:hypothetical protein
MSATSAKLGPADLPHSLSAEGVILERLLNQSIIDYGT